MHGSRFSPIPSRGATLKEDLRFEVDVVFEPNALSLRRIDFPSGFTDLEIIYQIRRRIFRLIAPVASLVPRCTSFRITTADELAIEINAGLAIAYPARYSVESPKLFEYHSHQLFLQAASRWDIRFLESAANGSEVPQSSIFRSGISQDKLCRAICLAGRMNPSNPDSTRNVHVKSLVGYAMKLRKYLDNPIIILADTGETLDDIDTLKEVGIYVDLDVQDDLSARTLVYETVAFSVLTNTGTAALAYLNKKTSYLMHGISQGGKFNDQWFAGKGYKRDHNPWVKDTGCRQFWKWGYVRSDYLSYSLISLGIGIKS